MPNPNTQPKEGSSILSQVAERVRTSDNVLVALSKDPSVDELSAALGLTFILDKMGKHATAIFSGAVPNAIEFLEPEKTFETNTNSLQDFIIALDKEKADHLRYKIDGDYVKVFITPYKTTIDEGDMEFSHGDYNVDLVIALNVASSDDLDSALTEYGRIMHDASSINISANVPGKFGDLEWGDPTASSVSEMVYKLSQAIKEKDKDGIDKSTATALLAGIVAATNRFSNERTSPGTMEVASKLMMAGADQQLISSSIPVDILTTDVVDATEDAREEEPKAKEASTEENAEEKGNAEAAPEPEAEPEPEPEPKEPQDPTNLEINHNDDSPKGDEKTDHQADSSNSDANNQLEPEGPKPVEEAPAIDADLSPEPIEVEPAPIEAEVPDLLPLSPTEAQQPEPAAAPEPEPAPIPAPAPTPESAPEPVEGPVEPPVMPIAPAEPEDLNELSTSAPVPAKDEQAEAAAKLEQLVTPSDTAAQNEVLSELQDVSAHTKKNLTPPSEALAPPKAPKDYAAMMESELSGEQPVSVVSNTPEESEPLVAPVPDEIPVMDTSPEPFVSSVQEAATGAVDNEYVDPLPMPDVNTILPPPPVPFDPSAAPESADVAPMPSAQDFSDQFQNAANEVKNTAEESITPNISMPSVSAQLMNDSGAQEAAPKGGVMPDQVYPADPGAFHIPGM